jgi:hypothetical protein
MAGVRLLNAGLPIPEASRVDFGYTIIQCCNEVFSSIIISNQQLVSSVWFKPIWKCIYILIAVYRHLTNSPVVAFQVGGESPINLIECKFYFLPGANAIRPVSNDWWYYYFTCSYSAIQIYANYLAWCQLHFNCINSGLVFAWAQYWDTRSHGLGSTWGSGCFPPSCRVTEQN